MSALPNYSITQWNLNQNPKTVEQLENVYRRAKDNLEEKHASGLNCSTCVGIAYSKVGVISMWDFDPRRAKTIETQKLSHVYMGTWLTAKVALNCRERMAPASHTRRSTTTQVTQLITWIRTIYCYCFEPLFFLFKVACYSELTKPNIPGGIFKPYIT